jgi:hypothetical protein
MPSTVKQVYQLFRYNIDINDSTLDGKNTFHATQMAAWQRGIGNGLQLDKLLPSSREILKHELMPVPIAIDPGVSNFEQEIGHI